jgi:iron(II)-dependent oxidoreductase
LAVEGGVLLGSRWRASCTIVDLLWCRTPVTRDQSVEAGVPVGLPAGRFDGGWPEAYAGLLPATRLTWYEASALAAAMGGRLPTSSEWEWMAGGGVRRYPWGDNAPERGHANLREGGLRRPSLVGSLPLGATPQGLFDVAGNVWEWTATTVPGSGAVVRGGSYNSLSLYARCVFVSDIPQDVVSPGVGLRVVRSL